MDCIFTHHAGYHARIGHHMHASYVHSLHMRESHVLACTHYARARTYCTYTHLKALHARAGTTQHELIIHDTYTRALHAHALAHRTHRTDVHARYDARACINCTRRTQPRTQCTSRHMYRTL
eukprot:3813314-Pleurochrysis_carterae.AAC.2